MTETSTCAASGPAAGDGQLDRVHRRALALEDQPGEVGCRPSGGPSLPRVPAAIRFADRDRGNLLSVRTKRNAMGRIRDLTPRPWGRTLQACILEINAWLSGWHQFFRGCEPGEEYVLRALDAHIRRRLRAILLHHWKRRPTIVRNLIALGIKPGQRGRPSIRDAGPCGRSAIFHKSTGRCGPGTSPTAVSCRWWSCTGPGTRRSSPPPTSSWRWSGDRARSRKAAGGGVHNPPSRGAVCEQHKHGSVGAGAGNRPGYPTAGIRGRRARLVRPLQHQILRPRFGRTARRAVLGAQTCFRGPARRGGHVYATMWLRFDATRFAAHRRS